MSINSTLAKPLWFHVFNVICVLITKETSLNTDILLIKIQKTQGKKIQVFAFCTAGSQEGDEE